MNLLMQIASNRIFISMGGSWFVAQLLKIIIDTAKNGFSADRLTGSGGMPSSHSATVIGLLMSVVYIDGVSGASFALAFTLMIIVVYDAAGVRMETGREARALNLLAARDAKEGKEPVVERKLREKMGHTIPEILVGIAIGFVISYLVCNYWPL